MKGSCTTRASALFAQQGWTCASFTRAAALATDVAVARVAVIRSVRVVNKIGTIAARTCMGVRPGNCISRYHIGTINVHYLCSIKRRKSHEECVPDCINEAKTQRVIHEPNPRRDEVSCEHGCPYIMGRQFDKLTTVWAHVNTETIDAHNIEIQIKLLIG